jgi:succinate dehydrogenase / fumarate reductase cytochrome b subunit
MLALSLHLAHGIWSVTQTLGVNRPNWEPGLRKIAAVVAAVIVVGFLSVPLGVITGMIHK